MPDLLGKRVRGAEVMVEKRRKSGAGGQRLQGHQQQVLDLDGVQALGPHTGNTEALLSGTGPELGGGAQRNKGGAGLGVPLTGR